MFQLINLLVKLLLIFIDCFYKNKRQIIKIVLLFRFFVL